LTEQLVHLATLRSSRFFVNCDLVCHDLRKYPPHTRRFSHPPDRKYIGASPHVGVVTLGCPVHQLEGGVHRLLESFIDLAFRPKERILVLYPFIITHRDATRIRENIRYEYHSLILEHSIRSRRRWAIRQLGDDLCFDSADVAER